MVVSGMFLGRPFFVSSSWKEGADPNSIWVREERLKGSALIPSRFLWCVGLKSGRLSEGERERERERERETHTHTGRRIERDGKRERARRKEIEG